MVDRRSVLGGSVACIFFGPLSNSTAGVAKDPCRGARSVGPSGFLDAPVGNARLGVGRNLPYFGDVMAAVHRDFQLVIETNLLGMPGTEINRLFNQLTDRELSSLLRKYNSVSLNSGKTPRLLDTVVPALDRRQTARLVQCVGFEPIYTATLRVAPHHAQSVLDELYAARRGAGEVQFGNGSFNENPLDYTIQEIYLSYRTAPKGSFSVPAAMYETATFAGTRLLGAFGAGYTVGTGIQQAWEYLSPNSWNSFSNFLGSSIDGFARSVGSTLGVTPYSSATNAMKMQIGAQEEELWNSFQRPGYASWFNSGGDFDVTAAWRDRFFYSCK